MSTTLSVGQIILLAAIQGLAELLPVSSSAHVIVAEKLMGLDPSSPELTFLLVMLHTGTMCAVLVYFWNRWRKLNLEFLKMTLVATVVTGVVGFGLKILLEKVILPPVLGVSHAEIEHLFKSLGLISVALFSVGVLILYSGLHEEKRKAKGVQAISRPHALLIGLVQGLCLPFRGFSRSGATISTGLLAGIDRNLAEDFSFALAIWVTPPVILLQIHRLMKASGLTFGAGQGSQWAELLFPGLLGMVFSFGAGLLALKWLSNWLVHSRWKYFGFYCLMASVVVFCLR